MGGFLRKQKYGICNILWHIPKYSIKKKKKTEISKYEISDLTTRMVLAKEKKKKAPSLSLSLTLSHT